ncbi:quinone oxidoreductase family protein [Actinoplanes subtropicus]|uniref:quinone oxidoreductase family protein n=1 Tax=Actinoplanes subtropicus TaxID=543632 RepID=UPI0004C2D054|nr:zinc-binding dehydrogenase [Actinoplanes subtropicus]
MRRVRYYEYGGPGVLTVEETSLPEPGPGQVRLRAEAIGANFVDTKIRGNAGGIFYRPLPGSPTGDVVGTIDATGPGVDPARLGERVAALVDPDAFADYALADAAWLAPVPAGLPAGPASLLPTAGPVALRVLRTGQVAAGETVLVHSAAGNIGGLAIQLAKLLGAGLVIATASTEEKRRHARELGADVSIDYTADDWPDQVRAAAPGGVDVALDAVGGATLTHSIDLLAPMGRAVIYGLAGGELADLPVRSFFAQRTVSGFSLLAWRKARPDQARAEMAEVAEYFADGRLHMDVRATLPLTEAAKAHELLEDRSTIGRVLLAP